MFNFQIHAELGNISTALRRYAELSGKAEDDVIRKKSADLSFRLKAGMRSLMPARGSVRAERVAALKAGGGIKIRPGVYEEIASRYGALTSVASRKTFLEVRRGKKVLAMAGTVGGLNLQALMAKRELGIRESARGFSAFSIPRPLSAEANSDTRQVSSRYGFPLSAFNMSVGDGVEHKYAEMRWFGANSGRYESSADALMAAKQQEVVLKVLRDMVADINEYTTRKIKEAILGAGLG